VIKAVQHFFEKNKPVAAICHGPQILAAAGVISGRACTAYPAVMHEVKSAGAQWIKPDEQATMAHVDGNLVTAAAWPGHPEWMSKFLYLLGSKIEP